MSYEAKWVCGSIIVAFLAWVYEAWKFDHRRSK